MVEKYDKAQVMAKLRDMGLDQIAGWVNMLPEEKWEARFLERWPALAKKCGIREEDFLLHR